MFLPDGYRAVDAGACRSGPVGRSRDRCLGQLDGLRDRAALLAEIAQLDGALSADDKTEETAAAAWVPAIVEDPLGVPLDRLQLDPPNQR